MSGRPINEDRQIAISLGFKTYTGAPHPKCGMTERYVSGGGCVHCARLIATEQREARKFLRAQSAPGYAEAEAQAEGFQEIDPDEQTEIFDALDKSDQALQDDRDEQAAAFQRSIEDLM